MKSKKHILLLTPGFPASANDTTCIPPLQSMVKEMQRSYAADVSLSVIAFQYPFERDHYKWNDINIYAAGGANRQLPFKIFTWQHIFKTVKKIHRQQPLDAVHSFWLHDCALTGQWISNKYSIPHFAHIMGQDILPGNRYLPFLKTGKMHLIANSEYSGRLAEENYGLKARSVIPFGIDPADFERVNILSRKYDLLSVGSLTNVKNHDLFIDMFHQLKKEFPSLTGRIIGEGPEEKNLSDKIKSLGLNDCLMLEGKKPRPEVLIRMSESKVLLHTAEFESAGYVFLEALYSGMKVISFHTGLLPVTPSSFPYKSKTEMMESIRKLLSQPLQCRREQVPLVSKTASEIVALYFQPRS